MFDKVKFMSFYQGTPNEASASICYDTIQTQLMNLGIYSELTMIGVMATIRTEVGRSFAPIEEISSGEQYENRPNLGNDVKGDGPRYKGKGLLQLTGRFNYETYTHKIKEDLVSFPQKLLDLTISAKVVAHYFKLNKIDVDCNKRDWKTVRIKVNGALNGWDTFKSVVEQYIG